MTTLTSNLVVRLIDQVTGPARAVSRSLLRLNSVASGNFTNRLGSAINSNNTALDRQRGSLLDAAAGFYLLKAAISSPVKAAMEFESAMADVRKVVDFGGEAGFEAFKNELIALSKVVPVSVNGLAQIAAAAGQAGIVGADLIKFTEAAAKIGVAFDISADQAGDAVAKLMTGLGLTIDEAILLTDSMNHLSNAQASSAAEILDFVRRTGAMAKGFNITATEAAAMGSAMIASGAQVDVAATSFQNMGAALVAGAAATGAQKKAFAALGLNAKKVAAAMQVDSTGTIIEVLERINQLPAEVRQGTIFQLFGKNADAIMPLVTNLDLLKESLGLVDDETKYAGSSLKEFEVRAKTFQNAVEIFNNRLTALKIVIGAALIPAINSLMDAISPVIDQIAAFAQANPELTRNVLAAAAAVVAFKIAVAGLSFIGLLGRGGALSMLALGFNTVGRAAIGASRAAKGAVGLQAALAAMSGAKFGGLAKVGVAIRGIAMAAPGVGLIGSALTAIGAGLAAISLPVAGAIALAVGAIAGAGFLIWKYWDRATSFLSGFFSRIGQEFAPAVEAAKPLFSWLGEIGEKIGGGFSAATTKLQEFGNWIASFFQREVLTEEQKAAWASSGSDLADGMINAIKAKVDELVAWFSDLGARIKAAVGDIVIEIGSAFTGPVSGALNGVANTLGIPKKITEPVQGAGGNTLFPVDQAPSGHRANGGPVWSGGSFLVGERGEPEIFTPSQSGQITPVASAGVGGARIDVGGIHINGTNLSPQQIATAIEDRLNRILRGAHSDSGAWA